MTLKPRESAARAVSQSLKDGKRYKVITLGAFTVLDSIFVFKDKAIKKTRARCGHQGLGFFGLLLS